MVLRFKYTSNGKRTETDGVGGRRFVTDEVSDAFTDCQFGVFLVPREIHCVTHVVRLSSNSRT